MQSMVIQILLMQQQVHMHPQQLAQLTLAGISLATL